ncbi:DUF1697 domain-containing protein [Brevundimonas sp.]|uniref:DUF1697 domain-containing protein n=1 Tax=Brevundimonas sp. TaxID=1871086 RepID=UPI0025E9A1D8|nr:DUF1697 domain-containing protein [Brevundimonas sp.]
MSEARICLLRGVNVGGVKVPMAELRALAEAAGLANPRTLLASGNLVADSADPPARVEAKLEAALEQHFGRRIEVIVRTPAQWSGMMRANPFADQAREDGSRMLVMVMKDGVKPGAIEALSGFAQGEERVAEAGGDLFFWHPDGIGRSVMAAKALPRLIGVGTGRNWNTVEKLAVMAGLEA